MNLRVPDNVRLFALIRYHLLEVSMEKMNYKNGRLAFCFGSVIVLLIGTIANYIVHPNWENELSRLLLIIVIIILSPATISSIMSAVKINKILNNHVRKISLAAFRIRGNLQVEETALKSTPQKDPSNNKSQLKRSLTARKAVHSSRANYEPPIELFNNNRVRRATSAQLAKVPFSHFPLTFHFSLFSFSSLFSFLFSLFSFLFSFFFFLFSLFSFFSFLFSFLLSPSLSYRIYYKIKNKFRTQHSLQTSKLPLI